MKQLYMFKALLIACIMIFFGGGNFALAQTTETVTIWSEDWAGYTANQTPSSGNDAYEQTNYGNSLTKIYAASLAGGTSPELLIAKNGGSWTVTVNDLKGCTGNLTLTYMANKPSLKVTADGNEVKMTASSNKYTGTFSVNDNSVKIVFTTTSSDNVRIDDIVLTGTKTAGPEFSFSASEATAIIGEDFTAPTLINTYEDKNVTYSSSAETVATVDAEGKVTPLSVGTTVITATLASDATVTASYTLTVKEAGLKTMTLSIDPEAGTYPAAQTVTLTSSYEGAKIYYTTDDTEPTTESAEYTAAIPVTISGTTVKALAVAEGYDNATIEAAYTIKPDQPKFSEESKTFKDPLAVTLTLPETASAGAKIHYAIDGTATAESDVYDGTPITISGKNDGEKIILHAVVVDEYGNVGTEKYCTYTYSDAIIFDFTANPNVWGIEPTNDNTVSNTDGKTLEVAGVVLTTASGTGTYKTCIYGTSSYTLRMYKDGSSITLTAPANYEITSVTFTGSSLNNLKEETTGTAVSTTNNKWEGSAQAITFIASGSCQIKTISVTLKKMPAPTTGTFTFTAQDAEGNYYATFSTDHYIVFPEEVELSTVTGINEDGTLMYFVKTPDETPVTDEVGSVKGSLVPKNTGVLLKSSKAEVTYYFPTSDVTGSIISWFKPVTNEDGTFEGREGYKYYKLAYDNYTDKTGLGFYWGAENGAPFKSKKGLAVLEVPETTTSGAAPTHFLIGGGTDGISNVKSDVKADKDGVIYNIAGQRVNAATKPGLYIIGGKKVVVK